MTIQGVHYWGQRELALSRESLVRVNTSLNGGRGPECTSKRGEHARGRGKEDALVNVRETLHEGGRDRGNCGGCCQRKIGVLRGRE